ncbi:MAG: T9SS type A sorting domain-containing protein [Bacteroidales bacterium]|nr:T9SS type A sorting domain-containing protein [Bacteroidales bacterium]
MKKILNVLTVMALLIFGMASVSAQTPVFSEDFSAVTEAGTQQCHASGYAFNTNELGTVLPGWSSADENLKIYPADGKVKMGTGSIKGTLRTPAIDLSGTSGVISLYFDAKAWNSSSEKTQLVVKVNDQSFVVDSLPKVNTADTSFCDMRTYHIECAAGNTAVITFEGYQDANSRFFIDNVVVYASTEPDLYVEVSPSATLNMVPLNSSQTFTISASALNFSPSENTTVTLNGASEFTCNTTSISAAELTATASFDVNFVTANAGTFTTTVTLTHGDIVKNVLLTVNAAEIIEVATIRELRNLIDNSDITANYTDSTLYKYTGEALITQTFRSGSYNKWMQDETGAIQLYDPSLHIVSVGQDRSITNLVGNLCNYFGYVEFKVQAGLAATDINPFPSINIQPRIITLQNLQDETFMDSIQGMLVELECVSFEATGNFTKYVRYAASDGSFTDTTALYFSGAYDTYVDEPIPSGSVSVIGVNVRTAVQISSNASDGRYPSRYYIYPREMGNCTGVEENEGAQAITVYPNPTSGMVHLHIASAATTVHIYNMYGAWVGTQNVQEGDNTLNLSDMSNGMYFLRIYNGNQPVGNAKVVRQ